MPPSRRNANNGVDSKKQCPSMMLMLFLTLLLFMYCITMWSAINTMYFQQTYGLFLTNYYFPPLWVGVIVVTSCMLLALLWGAWGVVKCNQKKTLMFSCMLFLGFLMNFFCAITYYEVLNNDISDYYVRDMRVYERENINMDVFDTMQHELGCCGTLGPNTWLLSQDQKIPDSCCRNMYTGCGEDNRNKTLSFYLLGCAQVLDTNARWQFASCARASWITALLELTGMFFTLWSGLTWMKPSSTQQPIRRRVPTSPPPYTHTSLDTINNTNNNNITKTPFEFAQLSVPTETSVTAQPITSVTEAVTFTSTVTNVPTAEQQA